MMDGRLAWVLALLAALTLGAPALVRRRPAAGRGRLLLLGVGIIGAAWFVATFGLKLSTYFT